MKTTDAPTPYGTPRKPGVSLDFVTPVETITNLSPAIRAKARRAIASRAADAADARLLLDVLGLLPIATPAEATP